MSDWSSDVCSSELREAPEAGESGRVLVPEAVGRVVGGQAVVVEAVGTAPSCDLAGAGREVEPDVAGDVALALHHEGVERLLEGAEPEAVVDELGVARLEAGLLALEVALEADALEVAVGHDQRQAGRALVGLPALDAEAAVLDDVDATPAEGPDEVVELLDDAERGEVLAVDADGHDGLEADLDVDRLGGGGLGEQPDAGRRPVPRVLHLAALDGPAPSVVVDGVQDRKSTRLNSSP